MYTKGSPILFAAAAACSFANFTGSMVVRVVGGDPCGLSKKFMAVVQRDEEEIAIRFRNKHMHTNT